MGTKDKPAKFDCYANAAPNEPMFVLLARDRQAPQLVEQWAVRRTELGEDFAKVQEALDCAKAMRRYRYERKGAPECEYCESRGESECLKTSKELVSEDGILWWYWCSGHETFLATISQVGIMHRTIDEYFATDKPAQDKPKEQTELDRIVAHIRESCQYWALELRVHRLLPYLQVHGDPLYAALMALSDDERKACGVDEVQTKERPIRETQPAPAPAPAQVIPIDGPGVDANGWCNNCGHVVVHSWKTCALLLKEELTDAVKE